MNVRPPPSDRNQLMSTLGEAPFCLVLDTSLSMVNCNEALAEWLGHNDPRALWGRHLSETIDPSNRPKLDDLSRRLSSGAPLSLELLHLRRDGRTALAGYHIFPPGMLGAEHRHVVALGSDRQSAVDLLEEVIALKREQEVVLARTRELAAQLQVRNTDLAALSHMIRHDVNNSLNAINLASALADASRNPDDRRHHSAQIRQICRHIAGQLNGFVNLVDSVGPAEAARVCDLEESLREILNLVTDHHAGIPHRIVTRLAARTAWVAPDHLGQIFENLLDNAFKYHDPNRLPLELRITSRRVGDRVEVEVRDNGRGIAVDLQPGIFDLFQRAAPEVAAGSGIGLAIVKRMAEANDGRVVLESQPGRGTTFRVSLRAAPPSL